MKFYKQYTPYSEAEIKQMESRLGQDLPPDYRMFLLEYGGGQPENTLFEQFDDAGILIRQIWINVFLGNTGQAGTDLYQNAVTLRDRIHADFLPTAADGIGNYLCLCISDENKGKVYMWYQSGQKKPGIPPAKDELIYVADRITEILNELKPDE